MLRFRELRGDRTQDYVAKHVGLTQQTYRNYESGDRQADYATLIKLADYFGVSLDYLLGRQQPNISLERQELLNKVQKLSDAQVQVLLGVVNHLK